MARDEFERVPKRRTETMRWMSAVVVSAFVGAAATLVITPMVQKSSVGTAPPSASAPSQSAASQMSSSVNVNVNDGITQVVKQAEPDVVAIVNYTTSSDYFSQQSQTQASDIGSGVYFYKDANSAYIVTNNHVVQGGSKVDIVLKSKKQVQATVVGTDPYTDLAVLKVPLKTFSGVQPLQFANVKNLQVGEPVVAIGTPMGLDFADTVTSGIISGEQRMMPVEEPSSQQTLDYQSVIQTDAAINPGNSGGPLLNIKGQVVGINSSKIVAQNFEGMGFAIPADEVQQIASEIIKNGHAVHPAIGIAGIDLSSVPQGYINAPVNYGVYVESVTSSDAKSAGLKQGDVIISVNGTTVQTLADLRTALFKIQPGQTVSLVVYDGSTKKTLKVKVGQENSPNTTASGQSGNSGSSAGSGGSGSIPFGYGGGAGPGSGGSFGGVTPYTY